jgi:hypothetical protein
MGPKYLTTSFADIPCGILMCFIFMPIAQKANLFANSFCVMGPPYPILRGSMYKGVANLKGLELAFKLGSSFTLLLKARRGGGKKGTSCEEGFVIFSTKLQVT